MLINLDELFDRNRSDNLPNFFWKLFEVFFDKVIEHQAATASLNKLSVDACSSHYLMTRGLKTLRST